MTPPAPSKTIEQIDLEHKQAHKAWCEATRKVSRLVAEATPAKKKLQSLNARHKEEKEALKLKSKQIISNLYSQIEAEKHNLKIALIQLSNKQYSETQAIKKERAKELSSDDLIQARQTARELYDKLSQINREYFAIQDAQEKRT